MEDVQYKNNRLSDLSTLVSLYPPVLKPTKSFYEYVQNYCSLEISETSVNIERICGRIQFIKFFGSKLFMIKVESSNIELQILARIDYYCNINEFVYWKKVLRRGDIISAIGCPGKSEKGILSLIPNKIDLLAPCLHTIPKYHNGLTDDNSRFQKRYLDFIMHRDNRNIIIARSLVNKHIRDFLDSNGFIEIETPI